MEKDGCEGSDDREGARGMGGVGCWGGVGMEEGRRMDGGARMLGRGATLLAMAADSGSEGTRRRDEAEWRKKGGREGGERAARDVGLCPPLS